MENEFISIKGAKENNLKNIDLKLPRNKLIVFSGVSGCGKSSLAFDTIFAEGQRKYMESLSSYARQFLGQMQKPNVESIEGLSPAISIDQKSTSHNPRSTVGTVTEIYDYIRLLYAKVGTVFCPNCKKEIFSSTLDEITNLVMENHMGEKLVVLAPIEVMQKGSHVKTLEKLKHDGVVKVLIDDEIYNFDDFEDCEFAHLDKNKKHNISAVCDRIILKEESRSRLFESIEKATEMANGVVTIKSDGETKTYSTSHSCLKCGFSLPEISPRLFSFNAIQGACKTCDGLGTISDVCVDVVMQNKHLSIMEGAFSHCGLNPNYGPIVLSQLRSVGKRFNIDLYTPVESLSKQKIEILLFGHKNEKGVVDYDGICEQLRKKYIETSSEFLKRELCKFFIDKSCPTCHGNRLNAEALCVKVLNLNISEMCNKSVDFLLNFFQNFSLGHEKDEISKQIVKEITARLSFLKNVGLGYLTLSRGASTLSGGESQRIRLASQIGSGLVGVLYILDEPSIGLHESDNGKLIDALKKLRDLGNTVIVVEHDQSTIMEADFVVDIGKFAGKNGGEIVATGSPMDIANCKNSITGEYLSGAKKIQSHAKPHILNRGCLQVKGATLNNLKGIDAKFPVGALCVVSGVSGSGKSSLVNGIVYNAVARNLGLTAPDMSEFYEKIEGTENFDKIVMIDQSPIGRSPRSNPATYTGVFTAIRDLFASTQRAREKGYKTGRFSFNIKGGRCEACEGNGEKNIQMYFLPDVTVPCEVCHGKKYNEDTLECKYKGKSIFDVLDMSIDEALPFFENIPSIKSKIKALYDVGLGYIKLGQSSITLSGGEAQRVKLATELAKKQTGKTLYILDEPSTGLHPADVQKLVDILTALVDKGNTAIVIEHNIDIIKCADYVLDLGPNGGDKGGEIVAFGTPQEISKCKKSLTGVYLK